MWATFIDGDLCWQVDMIPIASVRCGRAYAANARVQLQPRVSTGSRSVRDPLRGKCQREWLRLVDSVYSKICPSSVAHVCVSASGIISVAVIRTGWLVRRADWSNGNRGEWGRWAGVAWGGDWVARHWQKCNALGYWLEEVLIWRLMDGASPPPMCESPSCRLLYTGRALKNDL